MTGGLSLFLRRSAVFLLAMGTMGGPATALAEEVGVDAPTTYLVAFPTEASTVGAARTVQLRLRDRLQRAESIPYETPDNLVMAHPAAAEASLREGLAQLEAGQGAYLNLQLGEAVTALKAALAALDEAAAVVNDPQPIGQALLFLGASQVALGQTQAAQDSFQMLHRQLPGVEPDPQVFNPSVVSAFRQAGRRIEPAGEVSITSAVPGAMAEVDARPVGPTPATVQGLAAGDHAFRVTRAGHEPALRSVALRPRRQGRIALNPEPGAGAPAILAAEESLRSEGLPTLLEAGAPLDRLSETLGLGILGAVRVAPGEADGAISLEMAAYDVRGGARIFHAEEEATDEAALQQTTDQLATELLSALDAHNTSQGQPLAHANPQRTDGSSDEGNDGSLVEKWYFWAAVAAVVAGGSVATYLLLQDGDEQAGGQVVLRF